MTGPDFDAEGRLIQPPLAEFNRFIEQGMSCIVRFAVDEAGLTKDRRSIQFSMTPQQCRDVAQQLLICAQVIEHERPSVSQ
jgi:hypothetical protein